MLRVLKVLLFFSSWIVFFFFIYRFFSTLRNGQNIIKVLNYKVFLKFDVITYLLLIFIYNYEHSKNEEEKNEKFDFFFLKKLSN